MNLLIIDTSCDSLTLALKKGDELFKYKSLESRKGHSAFLLVGINELLQKAQLTLSDIDYFGAVVGPGSFTGVRVGVATVNAFSYATNKEVVSVTSFEPFAYNMPEGKLFAIDAKHGNYYTAKKVQDGLSYETLEGVTLPDSASVLDVSSVTPELLIAVMEEKVKRGDTSKTIKPFYMRASEAERNLKK